MEILVGHTGFVGSNILAAHAFDRLFNSKNIKEAYGLNPDLCVYSGVRAEKYLANNFPEEDLASINDAINNIKQINPKRIVLISTVDVLEYPYGDESSKHYSPLPYGKNRRILERFVEDNFDDYLIVRLPGLYGQGLKKNFIYDYLNPIPKLLGGAKFRELATKEPKLQNFYRLNEKGFFEINDISLLSSEELASLFKKVGFSALNFTDSRASLQFYNLAFLWNHIDICFRNHIKLIHIAPEPVLIGDIYHKLEHKDFVNELNSPYLTYCLQTKHWQLFGNTKRYTFNKQFVLNDIDKFIHGPKFSLAVSNLAFPNDRFDEIVAFMKEHGYRGLELLPTKISGTSTIPFDSCAASIFEQTKGLLPVVSLQSILYGVSLNIFKKNEAPLLVDEMKRVICLAEQIKCPNLVFGCPKNRNRSEEDDVDNAVAFFRQVADFAAAHGVKIALEANPKIYNTNFLNTTQEAIAFCKAVNHPAITINLDLGTVIYNGEDLDKIFDDVDLINHIHISEPYLKQIKLKDVHFRLFQKIIETDYSHFVSLELKEGDYEIKDVLSTIARLANRI